MLQKLKSKKEELMSLFLLFKRRLAQGAARVDIEDEPTLAVEFDESLLILSQLSPARHLIDLPLQDGDLSVPPSLNREASQTRAFQTQKLMEP